MQGKLFTIFLTFSDHSEGIGQHRSEDPEEALKEFIHSSESLEDYDRESLAKALMPLTQLANEKGVWLFHFNSDFMKVEWPGDNAVLGGHIVQTDNEAPVRASNA